MYNNDLTTSDSFIRAEEYRQQMVDIADRQFLDAMREFERVLNQHGPEKVIANLSEEGYWMLSRALKG